MIVPIIVNDLAHPAEADLPPLPWLERAQESLFCYQQKCDGIRVLARDGHLFTRNGQEITWAFPEISAPKGWVLDGEVAVVGAPGQAHDFEEVNRRARGKDGGIASLYVFDAMAQGRHDLRGKDYHARWLTMASHLPAADGLHLLPVHEDGIALWHQILADGGEGVIARLGTAKYLAGRHHTMVKLKATSTTSVIVVGRTPGKGSRAASFGSLRLAVIDGTAQQGFREVGEVGSGFDKSAIEEMLVLLDAGSPFVIDVEHLGRTSTGKLRHPVFVRTRPDMNPLEVIS